MVPGLAKVVPDRVCPANGLLIRVEGISIEGGDPANRGAGPLLAQPYIVGYQAAATVVQVGAKVEDFEVGQKVTTSGLNGSHAELRAVIALTA